MGGRGWAGWSGVRGGGIWDNCNSIINKYIFLKEEKKKRCFKFGCPSHTNVGIGSDKNNQNIWKFLILGSCTLIFHFVKSTRGNNI